LIDLNPAKVGVDNPTARRKEQGPFETWAEVEAVAAALGGQPVCLRRLRAPAGARGAV
jgi:hypothetical protein